MKKRTTLLLVVVLLILSLTACGRDRTTTANPSDRNAAEMSNFKAIEDSDCLAYSKDTKVVYYMFTTYDGAGYKGYGYSYFAPYISENGHFCKYINDEIVEITNDTNK